MSIGENNIEQHIMPQMEVGISPIECHLDENTACPFSFTDRSQEIGAMGCLPDIAEIRVMRVKHGKTWACHSNQSKPCIGAICQLKKEGLPYKVEDHNLVKLTSDWGQFT